jgi:hypothetical protein
MKMGCGFIGALKNQEWVSPSTNSTADAGRRREDFALLTAHCPLFLLTDPELRRLYIRKEKMKPEEAAGVN